MLLDIKKSKSGESLVITDPGGDVHACPNQEEFWTCVREIIDSPAMPEREVVPPAGPRSRTNGSGGEFYEDGDDLVSELGGKMLQGIVSGLQNMSYRGKSRGRPKKPPAPEETDG
jgi:hypothetical protein